MPKLSDIQRDYLKSGAAQDLIGMQFFVEEDSSVFRCRSGSIGLGFRMKGRDPHCLEASQLRYISEQWATGSRLLGPEFHNRQYSIKRMHPQIPRGPYDDPEVERLCGERASQVERRGDRLYAVRPYTCILLEPEKTDKGINQEVTVARIQRLKQAGLDLMDYLGAELGLEVLDKYDTFNLQRELINLKDDPRPVPSNGDLDYFACDSFINSWRQDSQHTGPYLEINGVYTQIMTLRSWDNLPLTTDPNMFQMLYQIPCDCIIASFWRSENPADTKLRMLGRRRHSLLTSKSSAQSGIIAVFGGKKDPNARELYDETKMSDYDKLNYAEREMNDTGLSYGQYSLYVVLHGSEERVRTAMVQVSKAFAQVEGSILEDRQNLLRAFRCIQPGNEAYDIRQYRISRKNYGDLAGIFATDTGPVIKSGHEYLMVLETKHGDGTGAGTPFYLHQDFRAPHWLIDGSPGSGKTMLVQCTLGNVLKYNPIVRIWDMKQSYRALTERVGGSWFSFSSGNHPMNPLSLPGTAENIQFLTQFVRVLVEGGGGTLTVDDQKRLYENIGVLYRSTLSPKVRRLSTVRNMLRKPLQPYLDRWCEHGQYGHFFDNEHDTLGSANWQSLEFGGMDRYREVIDPLMFYLLYCTDQMVSDPALAKVFKLLSLDEGWNLIEHPLIRSYVERVLRTYRDKNASIIICTQNLRDLEKSGLLRTALDCCPTRFLLHHHHIDPVEYREKLGLNDAAIEALQYLKRQQDMLYVTTEGAKVLQFHASEKEMAFYGGS